MIKLCTYRVLKFVIAFNIKYSRYDKVHKKMFAKFPKLLNIKYALSFNLVDHFSPEHDDRTMIVKSNPKQLLNLIGFLF